MPEARAGISLVTKYVGAGFRQARTDAQKTATSIRGFARQANQDLGFALTSQQAFTQLTGAVKDFAVESLKAADQSRSVGQSFLFISGGAERAQKNMEALGKATKGLVSETEQQEIANRLLAMGIVETADELEKITNVSRRLGGTFKGLGAADAAEEFAILISNMSFARLDSFGISSARVKQRVKELKEETQGMSQEAAFFQATMEEAEKTLAGLGPEIDSNAKAAQRLAASYSDFQSSFGELLQTLGGSQIIEWLDDLVVSLDDGAKAWNNFFDQVAITRDALAEVQPELTGVEKGFTDFMRFVGPDFLADFVEMNIASSFHTEEFAEAMTAAGEAANAEADALDELAQQQHEAAEAAAAAAEAIAEEEKKRLAKVADIKRDVMRDLMDIQTQFEEDSLEAQAEYVADREAEIKRSDDRIASLKARAAKEQLKADKKLAKDLLKVDTDLNKSLQRLRQDTDKKVKRIEQDVRRDARKASQTRQTDGLQDERLFQFELRQLAAEGEGNAIAAALERREIEKQIASEKRQETQQDEQEDARIQIQRLREDADIRAQRLREDAQQRKQIIQEEAALERETRAEELKIATAEENKALDERLEELHKFNVERLDEIEETKKESIRKTAAELTTIKDITRTELRELSKQAGELGDDVGAQFARGLNDGFNRENRIDDILNDLGISSLRGRGGGGFGGNRRGSGNPSSMMMFQHGGEFRVGGSGGPDSQLVNFLASPGETVTVSPPGQSMSPTFNINATGEGGAQLADILERKVNEALQEYTDTVIVPVLQ